jgi:hypothetical protein
MRTIREILRLSFTTTLSDRMIAQSVRCSVSVRASTSLPADDVIVGSHHTT